MKKFTSLLIIGAGPFGLSVAAHVQQLGIDYIEVGKPMEFWKKNMPDGMFLRSGTGWHLDADNEDTIEKFIETQKLKESELKPFPLQSYLAYTKWFIEQKKSIFLPVYIEQLDYEKEYLYRALTDNKEIIYARNVVIAAGFKYFKYMPEEITRLLPPDCYSHTCDTTDLKQMKSKRLLIIGGRQSAFEWAALLNEAGATKVHISYRHDSPAFETSDWSWANTMVSKYEETCYGFTSFHLQKRKIYTKSFGRKGV